MRANLLAADHLGNAQPGLVATAKQLIDRPLPPKISNNTDFAVREVVKVV